MGIFSAQHALMTQLIGVLAYAAIALPAALLIFFALKLAMGLRVSEEEERMGLDLGEHGMEAYAGFQLVHVGASAGRRTPLVPEVSRPAAAPALKVNTETAQGE